MTTGLGVWDYGKDFASMLSMAFLVRAMALLREIGPDISINGWQITKKKKKSTDHQGYTAQFAACAGLVARAPGQFFPIVGMTIGLA